MDFTQDDFRFQARNFDLTDGQNVVRITAASAR